MSGLWLPPEKPEEPKKPKYLTSWDCPNCGQFFDGTKGYEESTVGSFGPGPFIPHVTCPNCKECMGCL